MSVPGADLLQHLLVPAKEASVTSTAPSTLQPQPELLPRDEKYADCCPTQEMDMDIDVRAPVAAMHTVRLPAVPASAGSILSLNEYLTAHDDTPTKPTNPDPRQKQKQAPRPEAASRGAGDAAPAPSPVALPMALPARSSRNIAELHHKCQAKGIPWPRFIDLGDSGQGWGVMIRFLDEDFVVEGSCPSKQVAKEKVCGQALAFLEVAEREGRVSGVSGKRKTGEVNGSEESLSKEPAEEFVNYKGQLSEFLTSQGCQFPIYNEYALGLQFACELVLSHPSTGPQTFGSRTTPFSSKKTAQQAASRLAIDFFRARDLWPETYTPLGGIRKKRQSGASAAPSSSPTPTPVLLASKSPASPPSSSSPSSPPSCVSPSPSIATAPSQVNALAVYLGLGTPEWRFDTAPSSLEESSSSPGFHSLACYFREGGRHCGPLGAVRNVFGKKRAKEECARLVVAYLEDVKRERLAKFQGLFKGDDGARRAKETTAGRSQPRQWVMVNGELVKVDGGARGIKEEEEAAVVGEKEEHDAVMEEGSDLGFEDAVQYMH